MPYKLGKLPARPDAVTLKFADVFNVAKLPQPPKVFGHQWPVHSWGMLGNDQYGCCVWAGAAHETMLYSAEWTKNPAKFSEANVLADYAAVTGFNPNDANSDQGTDMQKAASYRRKTGVIDVTGKRHLIDSYVAIKAGNVEQLALAMWLFGAAGVGLQLPSNAEDQFDAKKPWSVVPHASVNGGHYVSGVGRNANGNFVVVTWGRTQEMTPDFFAKYCDEAVCYLSLETLKNNVTLEGFDLTVLRQHLKQLA